MAPPRLPPDLIHDFAGEILLRIPPDEPAHLFRASLVCDLWFRVATDPAFRRRYRAFHPSAPLLGFFYNRPLAPSPCFVSTTAASPLPQGASVPRASSVLDCRHGRVLLAKKGSRDLLVWDPITDGWWELRAPDVICFCSAVVLCAVAGCNHHDCGSGPFVVVCVATDDLDSCIRACVYSSEARAWDKPASAQLDRVHFTDIEHAVLTGDGIYWTVAGGYRILKYDLVKHCFSLINPPGGSPVLMQNEDGSLGLASVRDSRLYLWSRMVNPEGVSGWVQQRVMELNKILPGNKDYIQANVIGVAEGVGILFIRTEDDTFTFELNSEQVKKVAGPRKSSSIFPFISFCTPDCARIKLPLQAEELTTTVPEE